MKKFYLLLFLLVNLSLFSTAQNFWTGNAGDHLWSSPTNWSLGLPQAAHNVVIDNSIEGGSFTVIMPDILVTVASITITPDLGNTITVTLPITNTLQPGLILNGPGDVLLINDGGIFKNSSGAVAGTPINFVNANDSIVINNGGKYVHNNARAHAYLVDRLSADPGTETGIFEFDIPTPGTAPISLSARKYGTLMLSAITAGTKTYIGSGSSDLTVRGDLIINTAVIFSPTLNSNINIAQDLVITGNFTFNPQTNGATNRSIFFNGTVNQNISGAGTFTLGANFRNMEVLANAKVFLQRNINLPVTAAFIINTDGSLYTGTNTLTGTGGFVQNDYGLLGIGSPDGITLADPLGNVQTTTRGYNVTGKFEYNAATPQVTGNGLPPSVSDLIINNSANETITLTNPVNIDNELSLQKGFLTTTNLIAPTLRDTTTIVSPASEYLPYGASDIGWENSFVNGPLHIDINSTVKKWLPVGNVTIIDTLFAPIAIQKFNNTLATYTATYFPEAHFQVGNVDFGPLHHVSSLEYWDIDCNVLPSPDKDARLTLSWRPYSKVGNGVPANDAQALLDLTIAHFYDDGNGTKWRMDGNVHTYASNGTPKDYGLITASGDLTTTFTTAAFTLGTKSPFNILPVRFLEFNAREEGKNIAVQWSTKEEQGLDYYDVEKSIDGITFKKIATVQALNNYLLNNYNITDAHPSNGKNFYRLKITDAQHKSTFSKIVKVDFGKNNPVIIYPNPVSSELRINIPASSSIYTINIVNTNGQIIKQFRSTAQNLVLNVTSLSKGMYFLHIHNDLQTFTQKFTKH